MNQFVVKIADHITEIRTIHVRSMSMCRPFITLETAESVIIMDQKDIDAARKQYEALNGECTLWDGCMETYALHSKISELLIDYDVLMIHGVAIACRGEVYLFSAPSGTGKTTHIRKWLENLPDTFIVNGDKPFIKFPEDGSRPLACGSPWAGKENMYTNTMVPLKSIVLMERAEENQIEQMSFAKAFPKLLQQVYRPEDEDKMRKTLQLMQRLNPAVSFWRFQCNNFKDDCFDVAYHALMGKEE